MRSENRKENKKSDKNLWLQSLLVNAKKAKGCEGEGMSSTLYYSPVSSGKVLPDELKIILRDKHGLQEEAIYDGNFVFYLEALDDAGIKGAKELAKAIEKYGEVRLTLEYGEVRLTLEY